MRDVLEVYDRWVEQGKRVAVATVIRVKGSAPRGVGAKMVISSEGEMEGSVSGGCVENDVREHAANVLSSGIPKLVTYGIADDDAFEVGLTCGGTIEVYIAPWGEQRDVLSGLVDDERLGAMISVIEGPDVGSSVILDRSNGVISGGEHGWLDDDVTTDAENLMEREESRSLTYGERRLFVDTIAPSPVMLIFGAGHIAQPLSLIAKELGFRVVVGDARATWATPERFPHVDELIVAWPEDVFDHITPDHRTYVVMLSHDSRFEIPVFRAVHGKQIRYLGAMGSRRTHGMRVERLLGEGWSADEVEKIHGPIGLDLKAKQPAETAVAILAEIVKVRYGAGSSLSLCGTDAPIHTE